MEDLKVQFGLNVALRGPLATPDFITGFSREAEAHGFDFMAVPDHLVVPRHIESVYPYSATGAFPGQDSGDTLEQLTTMTWIAAATSRLRVLSSVMVVPHRRPVQTAKALGTLDLLSGGRLTVGVGAGWLREEFEAVGAPDFDERGRVTDEYLEAMKRVWTEAEPVFRGEYSHFASVSMLPGPVQVPHPPLWVGGESRAAMRRTVRHGDAWYPIGVNPRFPLNTRSRYAAAVTALHTLAEQAGRDPATLGLAYWANWYDESRDALDEDGERHLFTGPDDAIVEDIEWMREQGVGTLLFNFLRGDPAQSSSAMARFVGEVLEKVRDPAGG